LSFPYWLTRIAGAVVLLIVLLTLVALLDQSAFYVAILGTIVASVGSLVTFIGLGDQTREWAGYLSGGGSLTSAMSLLAFFLWLVTGVVIYQIPVDAPVVTTSPPPAELDSANNHDNV
jgi:hypothetical protein